MYELDNKKIKKVRMIKGLTQMKMACLLKITRSAYTKNESGTREFSIAEIYILSQYFNVLIEDLLL